MYVWLAIAAMLASFAVAEPASATAALASPSGAVSDTARAPRVHRDRASETCTRTFCTAAPGSSAWSAALGFGVTTLAAAGLSRRRSPSTR